MYLSFSIFEQSVDGLWIDRVSVGYFYVDHDKKKYQVYNSIYFMVISRILSYEWLHNVTKRGVGSMQIQSNLYIMGDSGEPENLPFMSSSQWFAI